MGAEFREANSLVSFLAVFIHPEDKKPFCLYDTFMVEIKAPNLQIAKLLAENSPQFCDGCQRNYKLDKIFPH